VQASEPEVVCFTERVDIHADADARDARICWLMSRRALRQNLLRAVQIPSGGDLESEVVTVDHMNFVAHRGEDGCVVGELGVIRRCVGGIQLTAREPLRGLSRREIAAINDAEDFTPRARSFDAVDEGKRRNNSLVAGVDGRDDRVEES